MTSIRRFIYASLLVLTTLNLAPSLASAQEPASGRFTLPHDVLWGKANVPAGDYRFSYDSNGISGVLSLSKLDGARNAGLPGIWLHRGRPRPLATCQPAHVADSFPHAIEILLALGG